MGAVIEGCLNRIPSVGFSLLDYSPNADFDSARAEILEIVNVVLKNKLPYQTCLNVNIPSVSKSEIKGIKICRQADAHWEEKFDKRINPLGREYYWLTGEFINKDKGEDTDEWALGNGFISVVPTQFDLTAHHAIKDINNWEL